MFCSSGKHFKYLSGHLETGIFYFYCMGVHGSIVNFYVLKEVLVGMFCLVAKISCPFFLYLGREVVFQCRDEGPIRARVKWSRANNLPLPPGSKDLNGRLEMPNIQVWLHQCISLSTTLP